MALTERERTNDNPDNPVDRTCNVIKTTGLKKTKTGLPICPFIIWWGVGDRHGPEDVDDVSITLCTHPQASTKHEGNCTTENCPIVDHQFEDRY
jgi:hypothetical protein